MLAAVIASLATSVPAWAADGTEPPSWAPNYATWMYDLRHEIGSRSLMQVPLPGTHQSVTYAIPDNSSAEKAPDLVFDVQAILPAQIAKIKEIDTSDCPSFAGVNICDAVLELLDPLADIVQPLIDVVDDYAVTISAKWAKNQARTVRAQLDQGMRMLDFRICIDDSGRMRGCHGLFTNAQAEVFLGDIRGFLDTNPNEFIVLLLRAVEWDGEDPDQLAQLVRSTLGSYLITDVEAQRKPLMELWAESGRVFVINTGGLDDELYDFIHAEADTYEQVYEETTDAGFLLGQNIAGIKDRNLEDGLFLNSQTQLTFNQDILVNMGITWLLDREFDNLWSDDFNIEVGDFNAKREFWRALKRTVADQLGLNGFYASPNNYWGVLSSPDIDTDRKNSFENGSVGGLARTSANGVLVPVFRMIANEPQYRDKLNILSVDGYHNIRGFVDAMIGLAGDGRPELFTAQPRSSGGRPNVELLPAGLRVTLDGGQTHTSLPLVYQNASILLPSQFGEAEHHLTALDQLMIPQLAHPIVGWSEIYMGFDGQGSPFGDALEDPQVQIPESTLRLQQKFGYGGPATNYSEGPPVDFDDAIGPPSMVFHQGRLHVAYAAYSDSGGSIHPVLKVRSARLGPNFEGLGELSPGSFEVTEFPEIELPIRVGYDRGEPGCQVTEEIFFPGEEPTNAYEPYDCAYIFPGVQLVSSGSELLLVWAPPRPVDGENGWSWAFDEGCYDPDAYADDNPCLGFTGQEQYSPIDYERRFATLGDLRVARIEVDALGGLQGIDLDAALTLPTKDGGPVVHRPSAVAVDGRVFVAANVLPPPSQFSEPGEVQLFEIQVGGDGTLAVRTNQATSCLGPYYLCPEPGMISMFDWFGQLIFVGTDSFQGTFGVPVDIAPDGAFNPVPRESERRLVGHPFPLNNVRALNSTDAVWNWRMEVAAPLQPSVATVTVSKDFSDDNPGAATVSLACAEFPPTESIVALDDQASEASPAVFQVSGFYAEYGADGTVCSASEAPLPGYQADESACTDFSVPAGGEAGCQIVNTQKPVIIRAAKAYEEGNGPEAVFEASCDAGTLRVIKATASPGSPAEFELSDFPWDGANCSVTEPVPPAGFYQTESSCNGLLVAPSDEPVDCTITNAVTQARFLVTKAFSDGVDDSVEVALRCNGGLPLEQSFVISEGKPVNFLVMYFVEGAMDCAVTETVVADGYTPNYDNGTVVSTESCEYIGVASGQYACTIGNSADPATFTVIMDWVIEGSGGFEEMQEVDLTIQCDRPILDDDAVAPTLAEGTWSVTRTLHGDESTSVTVDVEQGPASCQATQALSQSGVEAEDDCGARELNAGEESSCTFTNTLFFEGVPTLSRSALVLMALLMLGLGFVGLRRLA